MTSCYWLKPEKAGKVEIAHINNPKKEGEGITTYCGEKILFCCDPKPRALGIGDLFSVMNLSIPICKECLRLVEEDTNFNEIAVNIAHFFDSGYYLTYQDVLKHLEQARKNKMIDLLLYELILIAKNGASGFLSTTNAQVGAIEAFKVIDEARNFRPVIDVLIESLSDNCYRDYSYTGLQSDEDDMRSPSQVAAEIFGLWKTEQAVEPIIEVLASLPTYCWTWNRAIMIESLGEIGDPRALPILESIKNCKENARFGVYSVDSKNIGDCAQKAIRKIMDNFNMFDYKVLQKVSDELDIPVMEIVVAYSIIKKLDPPLSLPESGIYEENMTDEEMEGRVKLLIKAIEIQNEFGSFDLKGYLFEGDWRWIEKEMFPVSREKTTGQYEYMVHSSKIIMTEEPVWPERILYVKAIPPIVKP